MEPRLIALKLFLAELGVPVEIETLDDRKRVQKAVYLGQLSGVDLGYRFGWYLMGPYCPSLTRDYYALAEAIASGDREYEQKQLREPFSSQLRAVKPLVSDVSQGVSLSQEGWLELLASFDYLRRVSKLSRSETFDTLRRAKSRLSDYAGNAEERLSEFGLATPG